MPLEFVVWRRKYIYMKVEKALVCLRCLMVIMIVSYSTPESFAQQRFSAGLVAGLNASQVDGDDLAGFDKVGLTGGIQAIMGFESALDLHFEFLYSERGSRPNILEPEYDPDIEINLKYAEIPIYMSLGDWWQEEGEYFKVSAHAGFSYARLINASVVDNYHPAEEGLDELVPYFTENDVSWLLGISYRMSKTWGLTGRYTRSIIPLFDAQKHNFNAQDLKSYFLTIRLEYYFQ